MNRRTLDILVPIGYVIAILVTVFFIDGATAAVAAIGALLVGAYYAGIRQNLKP